ncbi:heptaprenyl diphosphate synthase/octaprenyl-diphosphate synthase [Nonomuraea fuscirosea]|uniref:Heptaprenyl diphosphate synthase/octaprenyl-diphosphate synthase n=1 Tax=Nonomuraea fuscirosea TaxID=1291556 RepID=A0A2T0MX55_9ACTN|nr:polyprenyl synthetase family protein [Nonomuraea fuscirosea]PRX63660.1 heptaprenyl diphosphate synthase/octaprenyl-diphosphate synthase [Nonomuraea fuscirosea]
MDQLLRSPAVVAGLVKVEARIRRLSGSSVLPDINAGAGRVVSAGGKRLRPALTLAASIALGKPPDRRVITAAACVELIHTGSLVHDDLMDRADRRRGQRTLNAELGDGKALVIGDFMLARAALAAIVNVSRPVAEVLAATVVELAEGQYLETADLFDTGRTRESAVRSITGKTAALFRAGCLVAALCAHAPAEDRARMAAYGEKFGLIFQVLDDLLDLTATSEQLGKPAGNDLRQGVYSLPLLMSGIDLARSGLVGRDMSEEQVATALRVLRSSPMAKHTIRYCRGLAADALAALPVIQDEEMGAVLRRLPSAYIDQVERQVYRVNQVNLAPVS